MEENWSRGQTNQLHGESSCSHAHTVPRALLAVCLADLQVILGQTLPRLSHLQSQEKALPFLGKLVQFVVCQTGMFSQVVFLTSLPFLASCHFWGRSPKSDSGMCTGGDPIHLLHVPCWTHIWGLLLAQVDPAENQIPHIHILIKKYSSFLNQSPC